MTRLRNVVDKTLAWLLIALMFVAVVNVLWQVFTRWVLDAPSAYTEELARYLLIWLSLVGAAYGVGNKIHLAIDLLPTMLEGRRRHALEIVVDACILLFAFFVLMVGGYRLVSMTLMMGQTSAALGLKIGYVYAVLPLSGLIIVFYAALSIRDRVALMRGKEVELVEPDRSTQKPID